METSPGRFEVLRELATVRRHLATVADKRAQLAARRLELYRQARAEGISFRAIGAAAGVSDAAVIRALEADDEAKASAG